MVRKTLRLHVLRNEHVFVHCCAAVDICFAEPGDIILRCPMAKERETASILHRIGLHHFQRAMFLPDTISLPNGCRQRGKNLYQGNVRHSRPIRHPIRIDQFHIVCIFIFGDGGV